MMKIKHALVVDDSKSARYSLKKMLEKQGLDVALAESAGDALNHLEIKLPDVIFMDHLMPGMDGFEATQAIKGNPVTSHIPIVMCTSKEGPEYAEQAMARGAIAILPKPAPVDALLAVFDKIQSSGAMPAASTEEPSSVSSTASLDVKQRVLENLVKDIVEDQLASIRTSVEKTVAQAVESQIEMAVTSLKADLFAEITSGLRPQINSAIETQTAEKVETVLDNRITSLQADLKTEVQQRIDVIQKDIQKTLDSPSDAFVSSVKEIVSQESHNIEHNIKDDLHQYIVQSASQAEFESLRDELKNEIKSGLSAISGAKTIGIIGAVLGAAALLMVLF
jgi:CheY-like chemotaxis protein